MSALEVDTRPLDSWRAPEAEWDALVAGASRRLRGKHRVELRGVNLFTGSPKTIVSFDSKPGRGWFMDRAIRHLDRLNSLLTGGARERLEFVPEPTLQHTSGGMARIIHLHQVRLGVPIFGARRSVEFDASGAVREVGGNSVRETGEPEIRPRQDVRDALLAATTHIRNAIEAEDGGDRSIPRLRISNRAPSVVTVHPGTRQATVLRKPPFGFVAAHLVLFNRGVDIRLGWSLSISLPEPEERHEFVVGADEELAGEILFCRRVSIDAGVVGSVYQRHPDNARVTVSFPTPIENYPRIRPADLPPGFPRRWVEESKTSGNNVEIRKKQSVTGVRLADGRLSFSPGGDRQRETVHAFYICNYLHDFFYLLGFGERERNFQEDNFGAGGKPGDALMVKIHEDWGPARFDPRADGRVCKMHLGRIETRRTAAESDIVIHEYVHGVTSRLILGEEVWLSQMGPLETQALDEGYCDYFALTIEHYRRLRQRANAAAPKRFAKWVSAVSPEPLRRHDQGSTFALRHGDVVSEQVHDEHEGGQVWCEALLRMNQKIGAAVGDRLRGHEIGWQVVVNSLKKIKDPEPGFVEGAQKALETLDHLAVSSPVLADGTPLLRPAETTLVRAKTKEAFDELEIHVD